MFCRPLRACVGGSPRPLKCVSARPVATTQNRAQRAAELRPRGPHRMLGHPPGGRLLRSNPLDRLRAAAHADPASHIGARAWRPGIQGGHDRREAVFSCLQVPALLFYGRPGREGLRPAGSLFPVRQPVRCLSPRLAAWCGNLNRKQGSTP